MRQLLAMLLSIPMFAAAAGSVYVMDLPMRMDDREIGTVTVGILGMELEYVQADSFSAAVKPHLNTQTLEAIAGLADPEGRISVERIRERGLALEFEPASLQLVLSPGRAQRAVRDMRGRAPGRSGVARSEASVAAVLNYNLTQDYVHQSRFEEGREPLRGVLDGAINLGFLGPVALESEVFYEEDEGETWRRGNSRLVVDDQARAIRYSAGDVFYQSGEFQGAPGLLGLSAERRYGVLQPFNIVTSSGQQTFFIDQTSRVDVYVNGIYQTSQRLAPGQYNLSDFAFADGLNDIELVVTDNFGRVERIGFSLFLDNNLLKPGVSEFSINAGVRRDPDSIEGIDYDYDRPAASGFFRYGVTEEVTLGVQAQGEEDLSVYGLEGIWGTPVGVFSTTGSYSNSEQFDEAVGAAGRWEYEVSVPGLTQPLSMQWATIYNEENYLSLGQDEPANVFEFQHQVRLASSLPWNTYFSVGYRQAKAFDPIEDESAVSLSVSKRFDWFNVNVFLDYVESEEDEVNALVNLSVPLGRGRQIRATYNRQQKTTGLQYSDYPVNAVHDLAGSIGIERDTLDMEEHRVSGALDYTGNRFVARIDHDYNQEGFFDGETEERTRAELGGALVFADGTVALSRPVFDAFAIVERHESLADTDIVVNETPYGPSAIANDFGPAVVPDLSSYRDQQVYWEAERPPAGYDMGDVGRRLTPNYKSGAVYMAGSSASVIAIGTVVVEDDQDVALKTLVVKPADGREFPERQTFTNRNGRFVVQKLEPGRYSITMSNGLQGVFTVPEEAIGYVELGQVKLGVAL